MTTATQNPIVDETYIPDDSEVSTPVGGRAVWRISNGTICTGREQDGSLQTREKITGRLRRIGIFFGKTRDTLEPYGQLEVDIETSGGIQRVKAGITEKGTGALKPGVAALSFAEGLLDCAKDELIIITANLSAKVNRFGKHSTYANLFHYNPATKAQKPTARRKRVEGQSIDAQWDALDKELRTHPAFADRPASEGDDENGDPMTHLPELCKVRLTWGWPTPEQRPADWLKLMGALHGHEVKSSLAAYDDYTWGQTRLGLQQWVAANPGKVPGLIAPPVQPAINMGALSGKGLEYDPLAAEDPFVKK